ncbi:MAG TPA: helix-turn-helix transcriptional regulator [Mycobacteriales bacterium]
MKASSPLRRWRVDACLTLDEVSDLTGLSKAMWSRVERGERSLAPMTRVRVARRLGVRVRDLFPVDDELSDAAS